MRGLGLLHHAQPLEGVREAARVHRIGDPIGGVFGALLPVAHRDAEITPDFLRTFGFRV